MKDKVMLFEVHKIPPRKKKNLAIIQFRKNSFLQAIFPQLLLNFAKQEIQFSQCLCSRPCRI